ncbi:MAG: ArnT family glycosyltransferase [Nitrospinota bacterium]
MNLSKMLSTARSLIDLPNRWQVPLSPASYGLSLFLLALALLWQNWSSTLIRNGDSAFFAIMARDLSAAPVHTWMRIDWKWDWYFYEKPPLILWAEAATMRLIGARPEAALLPTLIGSHLSVWLVYKMGKRLVNRDFGFVAALILVLTPWFVKQSRDPLAEPLLMFFIALALYWGMKIHRSWLFSLGGGFALACAILTKGPPAFVVLPVLVVCYLTFPSTSLGEYLRSPRYWRECVARLPWRRLGLYLVVAAGVLSLAELWHFSLWSYSYWKRFFFQQIVPAIGDKEQSSRWMLKAGHFYYLQVLGKRYWPWLPVLLAGLVAPWLVGREDPQRKALVRAWAFGLTQAGVLLLGFTFGVKRNSWYIYPCLIGFSLLTALAVYVFLRSRRGLYRYLVSGAFLLSIGIFILSAVAPQVFKSHPRPKFSALARLGEEVRRQGIRLDVLQLPQGFRCPWFSYSQWNFAWAAQFYLDAESLTCAAKPKSVQLLDLRRDGPDKRDGSRTLAIAYPFALVERRQSQGDAERPQAR